MILKAKISHKEQIANLWCDAFGDRREDVLKYLEFLLEYFYIYEEKGVVCAMAAVLPLTFNTKSGGYIYAVTTRENMRGKGISTRLLNYIKALNKYDFFVLVPQNDGLFSFYKRLGFNAFSSVEKNEVLSADSVEKSFKCVRISAKEYAFSRKTYFGDTLINWNPDVLEFAKNMYAGDFYKILQNEIIIGTCFCFMEKDRVVIKEILANNREELAGKIATYFDKKRAFVTYPSSESNPSAMVYPAITDKMYFAIALD